MKVEIFHAPGCPACGAALGELRAAAQDAVKGLDWHEVNIIDNVDRAVELGVMTLPAIAIDGELVFKSLPTAQQLRDALVTRNKGRG